MKKMVLLLCVVCVVLLTGCDVWDLLANNADFVEVMEELEEWMSYGDNSITLRVRRYGQQATATNPILWSVEGDITLALRPLHGGNLFAFGDAVVASAGWSFTGGGCEGAGSWPVRLFVVGYVFGEPECYIELNVVETWIGGDVSFMNCAGAGGDSVVNETLGYRFENLLFDANIEYFLEMPTAGIPSPGAASDDFGGWTWSSTWEITDITLPEGTDCDFGSGR